MFKLIILVTLCGFMLVESKPAHGVNDINKVEGNNSRVVRSAQHAQNAMNMAGQMANEGIQAATKGMNILATAAQQGISAGTAIAAEAAKSATSII